MTTPPVRGLTGPMSSADLERRVARLEDVEAIKNLKQTYTFHQDNGFDGEAMASLFTEDGVLDEGDLGVFRGREEIRAFFLGLRDALPFSRHHVTSPVIEVAEDGRSARGTFYLLELATLANGETGENEPWLVAADYEDDFVKEDGRWMFATVRMKYQMLTLWRTGWEPDRFRPLPGQ